MCVKSLTKTRTEFILRLVISIKIVAGELERLLHNALLYADEEAMRLQQILLVFGEETLQVYACDDYVAVTDSAELYDGRDLEVSLSIEDAKALVSWVKENKKIIHKYDIIIRPKMTGIIFECDETSTDEESDNLFFSDRLGNSEAWELVMQLLEPDQDIVYIKSFLIRPERISKSWRLKADKEAPIAFRGIDINGNNLIQFKKGETIVGCIMPVKPEYVEEKFLWQTTEA
jgi:hypothetical protein